MRQKVLWIGCLESDEEFKIKAKKGLTLGSAQVSQQNLINGIEEVSGLSFDSINGSVLPYYPIYKDKIVEKYKWSHKKESYDVSVGYKNYKYINRILCKYSMIKEAKKWVTNRYNNENLTVFAYSMRSPSMATAVSIKKMIPNSKIYLIVTDLPQYMDLGESRIKKILKKIDWLSIKRMQKQFDGFILYSEKMSEFLRIDDSKWILMEGSVNIKEKELNKTAIVEKNKVSIMYSGAIRLKYGIPELLQAFSSIEAENYELWFTGAGDADELIKKEAAKDPRIKHFGFLPSREDVLNLQSKATMLISTRMPTEEASAYCFPSKIFEYLLSGKPTLSFKIDGIPKEYYNYLITMDEVTPSEIRKAILKVGNMSQLERDEIGRAGRNFILDNKNNYVQSKKICKFVNLV